jgi:hypothetical protein
MKMKGFIRSSLSSIDIDFITPKARKKPILITGIRNVIINKNARNHILEEGVIGYREAGNRKASNVNKYVAINNGCKRTEMTLAAEFTLLQLFT